jgi:predicted fused transcriptional regulator/phosphomethylpyrimidine kinase
MNIMFTNHLREFRLENLRKELQNAAVEEIIRGLKLHSEKGALDALTFTIESVLEKEDSREDLIYALGEIGVLEATNTSIANAIYGDPK